MKQLSINVAKNIKISDLVCTPNVILLAKQTISDRNGDITTNIRYIEVCKVEKTDALTIVQSMLKYCIAEYFVCSDLENDFADTNIKQRKIFNQFLNTNTIYRTNAEGKITNALESEVPFSQTALKVKNTHTIANCKKDNLKAAIFQHSKAILSQCKYLRLIIDKVNVIDKELAKEPKVPKAPKAPKVAKTPKTVKVPRTPKTPKTTPTPTETTEVIAKTA